MEYLTPRHTFCRGCIQKWRKGTCPICRSNIVSLSLNETIQLEMEGVRICCPNSIKNKCSWTGRLSSLQAHENLQCSVIAKKRRRRNNRIVEKSPPLHQMRSLTMNADFSEQFGDLQNAFSSMRYKLKIEGLSSECKELESLGKRRNLTNLLE